jgi:RNA polymerase sigma factor (sigma-70 family)
LERRLLGESPNNIPPLLGQNKSGNKYRRTTEVERQIQSSLVLSDDEIVANAKITDQHADHYLREEALIFLIRQSNQERNQFLFNELFILLLERCKERISYILRSLDPGLKEDAFSEVNAKLIEKVLRDDGKGDFLQVRFWPTLSTLAIDVFRHFTFLDNEDHEYLEANAFSEQDPDQPEESDKALDTDQLIHGENRWSSVEKEVLVWDALQKLRPQVQKVYILYYYLDWPIDSKDDNQQTICKHFGVSGRTIQNWVNEAEEAIEKWRGDHHE